MDINGEQKAAVQAGIDQPIRVVAGAGTGKTRVLVERYLRFVRDGIPPARILALTFTLKAADEMRQRIFDAVAEDNPGLLRELYAAWIMNFHSFGYRVIRENAPALGVDPGVDVATNAELRRTDRVLEAHFLAGRIERIPSDFDFGGVMPSPTQLPSLFRMYLSVVKKCRGDMVPIEDVVNACTPEDHDSYVAHVGAVAAVYDAYAGELARQNLIDFGDMIARATRALAGNQRLGAVYRQKFDHILVDEFQDTSSAQYELLRALSGGDFRKVTVVGDEKQSIYRWRDARVENIRYFPGEDMPLSQNYRSRQNILDLAHAFICQDAYYAEQGDKIKLTADRTEPNVPIVVYEETPTQHNDAEAAALAGWAVHLTGGPAIPGAPNLVGEGTGEAPLGYGGIAVLLRAVREAKVLPSIERAFRAAGIPYAIVGASDASGSRALELFAAFLWLLLPGDRRADLLHVLESPPFAVGHASLIELFGEDGRTPGDAALLLSHERIDRVTDVDARKRLTDLRSLLDELQRRRASRDFRNFLLGAIEETPFFHRLFSDSVTFRAVDDQVSELMDICDKLERKGDLGLWAFLEQLRAVLDDRSFGKDEELAVAPDRVRIMTIHQAKGLEFPAVAVAGIKRSRSDSDGFYLSKTKGLFSDRWKDWNRGYNATEERDVEKNMKKQEERCLLYVAMTRAKDFLFVSSPYAGGVEKRGKSLFSDIAGITDGGRFDSVVIRKPIEISRAAASARREEGRAASDVAETLNSWRRMKDTLAEQEALTAVSTTPIQFVNWTALKSFADCPLRYQYRYVLRLGEALTGGETEGDTLAGEKGDDLESVRIPKGMSPAGYGIFIHELLRELMSKRAGGSSPQDGWIGVTATRLGVSARHVGRVVGSAERIVGAFAASELATPGDEIRLEEPFQIRLDSAVYHGIFDRVEHTADGWRVVDYKIGREREDYAFQVAFYAWALREITGGEDVAGRLCYLKESGTTVEAVDAFGIDIHTHAQALDESLTAGRYDATPGEDCRGCRYNVICDRQK
jgi:DNA helicase-2/ATP-dependent DNA helicase PcrA